MAIKIGSKYEEEKSELIEKIKKGDAVIIQNKEPSKLCYICNGINEKGENLLISYFDDNGNSVMSSVDIFCYVKNSE